MLADTLHQLLESAAQSLRAGQFAAADAHCRRALALDSGNALALQICGLAQRQLGDLGQAELLLTRSVDAAPGNPEFRTNLAQLLGARGKHAAGIEQFRRALTLDPQFRPALLGFARTANRNGDHAQAEALARRLVALDERSAEGWSALGTALLGLNRTSEARVAFEKAVTLTPNYGAARYHLAVALCAEEASEQALQQLATAAQLGIAHRGTTLTRARALMQLDRYEEADATLDSALRASPFDAEAQFLLAQLRHVRGDTDFARTFRAAAAAAAAPIAIRCGYVDVLRHAGQHDVAESSLRTLLREHGAMPELLSSLGTVLQETGRHTEAAAIASEALQSRPDDAGLTENCVAALLADGQADAALRHVEHFRRLAPADQRWITYRADVARQRNEDLYRELCDIGRLVRTYDLPTPAGFHEQIGALLGQRHRQSAHPLDQSVRWGTQTSRGLLHDTDPALRQLLALLDEAIAQYQSAVGHDPNHPFLARNRSAARMVGCWSIKLRRGGFHINHIHPQGWLSSAYYVHVPAESADVDARSGWLKFGEPRFAMPGGTPTHYVQPRAGRLVLFPSYMWHGTVPIVGEEPRLTVAFDAVPRGSDAAGS